MRTDYLMPPLPPIRPAASNGVAPAASAPVSSNHCTRDLTRDANVRKAESFFPRAATLINNTLRHLGLMRRSPVQLAHVRLCRKTYDHFRKLEGRISTTILEAYEGHLRNARLSTAEIKSSHRKFRRELAESFPAALQEIRAGQTSLDLSFALCSAYQLATEKVLDKPEAYSKRYRNAMKQPLSVIAGMLKVEAAQRANAPAPTPALPAAPTPNLRNTPAASSAQYRSEFTTTRGEVCDVLIERYKKAFEDAANGQAWPENMIEAFKWFYKRDYDSKLPQPSSQEVSTLALHEAHHEALKAAQDAAGQTGLAHAEINDSNKKMFAALLADLRMHISLETRLSATPQVTGLFQR